MNEPGIVIVGTGLAGYAAAREFRKWDKATSLTLVSADDGVYYSKPQLSASLASGKSPDSLALKDAAAMAVELGADIRPHTNVVGADAASKSLLLQDGTRLPYGKLILALGARARKADIRLEDGAPLHSVNNLDDYRRFHRALGTGKRVAILGSGLIGCEFANDLALARFDVTVVGNGAWPLQGLAPSGLGGALRRALGRLGVKWRLNEGIMAIDRTREGWKATLRSGATVEADVFLSAIGFDPNLDLARELGLATGRAIKVDNRLRTSLPDVHALGDCAEIEGRWLPFVLPINHAAKVLGQVLAGQTAEVVFPLMPVAVKTPAYPVCVLPPPLGRQGAWREIMDEAGAKATFVDSEERLQGFALGGSRSQERAAMLKLMTSVPG